MSEEQSLQTASRVTLPGGRIEELEEKYKITAPVLPFNTFPVVYNVLPLQKESSFLLSTRPCMQITS